MGYTQFNCKNTHMSCHNCKKCVNNISTTTAPTSEYYNCSAYSSSTLVGSISASIYCYYNCNYHYNVKRIIVLLKRKEEKKTSVPTDNNPVVIYDDIERAIDSFVPITDNPGYGTTLH